MSIDPGSESRESEVEKLVKYYKQYQDRLLQITRKNRSILLKKVYNKNNFDLVQLEGLKKGIVEKITTKAIKSANGSLTDQRNLSQNILLDSIQDEDADVARGKLKALSRNLKGIEEETGQQVGYLGFPFLQGHLDDDFYIRGPIMLFPISIEEVRQPKNSGWFVNYQESRPILNGALITALKKRGKYKITDEVEDSFDELVDAISDIKENHEEQFFSKVNDWVKNMIEIDEGRNMPQSTSLKNLTVSDIGELEKEPFHLVNYKIIGNFPQADNEIYRDYKELIDGSGSLDVGIIASLLGIKDFDGGSGENDEYQADIDSVPDKELNLVLESDSSQDQVILESKNLDMIVVRGPPGTGKSQVIVNLISDALTGGKKVLVVCQKRAALEVVKQRLGKVGLDKYAVFLEKELDDRVKMYQQLCGIIEKDPQPSPSGLTPEQVSAKIDECVKYLSDFGKAMRKEYFGGATAHKIYSESDGQYKPVLDLSSIPLDVKCNGLDEYIREIQNIEGDFKKFEDESNLWFGRRSFADLGMADENNLNNWLDELIEKVPTCMIANNVDGQRRLLELFETHLHNPGFMKRRRKQAAKEIEGILNAKVSDDFVSANLPKVENGIKFWETFSKLQDRFKDEKRDELLSNLLDENRQPQNSYLLHLKNTLEFDKMQEFDKQKKKHGSDMFPVLHHMKDRMEKSDNWAEKLRQEIYHDWLGKIEDLNAILKGDPIQRYERNKAELAELMVEKRDALQRSIRDKVDRVITTDEMHRSRAHTHRRWRSLYGDLQRRRKVKPVRKLFHEYAPELLSLAPCWLASPESVSKTFPLQKHLFDVVIVDEASQLAVERAIPFLYRAKHAIIAGDEKQLPPFDLFQSKDDSEDDYDDELISEHSLLDTARNMNKNFSLAWHYRSKYQELINFSNHAFYYGLLNVAPNAVTDPEYPPIKWVSCNGVYENKVNLVEAEKVVDVLKSVWDGEFAKNGRYPSVGIVAFNESQQECIKDAIEKRREGDPEFDGTYTSAHQGKKKDSELFIKNIENVQGDERDVIIFSIGYAKDSQGVFKNYFGTLNNKGGEKRLNVAITRAREQILVVCSINPNDIKPTSTNEGPRRFRQFLQYAKATSALDKNGQDMVISELDSSMSRVEQKSPVFDSEFEVQVHDELAKRGYKVDTQVGESGYRIDLAVVHPDDPNRYLLGIECDGATFHSAKSVKERDVMRQKFLENKGWVIARIWSRNWWKDPNRELDQIEDEIKKCMENPR